MTSPLLIPVGLRCAHLVSPLAVPPSRVRFSWALEGPGTGRAQHAYQVQVATAGTAFGSGRDLTWDSNRVESSGSADISYAGAPLTRGAGYTWRVRAWDETGTASAWSTPASFEVELDPDGGWRGSWISLPPARDRVNPPSGAGLGDHVAAAMSPAPYLRRTFTVVRPVTSARLYVTALGLYEARLNSHRVGDAVLPRAGPTTTSASATRPTTSRGCCPRRDNVIGVIRPTAGTPATSALTPSGLVPTMAPTRNYWPSSRSPMRTAARSRSSPTSTGRPGPARSARRPADGQRHLRLEPPGWDVPGSPRPRAGTRHAAAIWTAGRSSRIPGRPSGSPKTSLLSRSPGPATGGTSWTSARTCRAG